MRASTLLAAALLLAGCGGGGGAPKQGGGASGRTLFVRECGACHTLADAGTKGSFGADLERAKPSAATVLKVIDEGKGQMPGGLLRGEDAKRVADYVARAVRR